MFPKHHLNPQHKLLNNLSKGKWSLLRKKLKAQVCFFSFNFQKQSVQMFQTLQDVNLEMLVSSVGFSEQIVPVCHALLFHL